MQNKELWGRKSLLKLAFYTLKRNCNFFSRLMWKKWQISYVSQIFQSWPFFTRVEWKSRDFLSKNILNSCIYSLSKKHFLYNSWLEVIANVPTDNPYTFFQRKRSPSVLRIYWSNGHENLWFLSFFLFRAVKKEMKYGRDSKILHENRKAWTISSSITNFFMKYLGIPDTPYFLSNSGVLLSFVTKSLRKWRFYKIP